MDKPLRILNVENSERDSALLTRHMTAAGYDLFLERVETVEGLKAALMNQEWDLILCDYSMPRFSALAALTVLRASNIDLPFIIISGTVGEEIAVKALLGGANDYIPKGNLTRLIPAIQRELQQADGRRAKRKTEEALKASEAELRAVFAAMNDVILVFDYEGLHLKVAPTKPPHVYSSATHRIGKTVHEIFPQEIADFMLSNIQTCLDESRTLNVEYTLSIDGNDLWFDGTVTPMTKDSVIWVARDVTQRKLAEDELRESEERFVGAFEMAPIGVALVLPDGRWLKVNRAVCDLVGYTEAELLAGKFQDITHPDDLTTDFEHMRRLVDAEISHYQMEKRYIHKLGHIISILLSVSLVRNNQGIPIYFISQLQDITASKLAADELRESESLLAASQRITHLGSWVMNLSESQEGKRHNERWSDEHYRIFGYEPGELEITDEVFYNSVHPDDRERLAKAIREATDHGKPFDIEHRIILPDGRERIVQAIAEIYNDDITGKPLKLLGSVQDITERIRTQAALAESEERYRSVVETAADVIVTIDDLGTICFINPAAERIFGYGIDEMKGASLTMLMPEYLRHLHVPGIERYQKPGVKHESWEYMELTGLHKDGREIPIMLSFSEFNQNGRRYFTGIIRDITERKQTMEALARSEERYRELVENALDIIYTHDLNGNYTSVNKAAETITGYTNAEILAMNLTDTIPPEQLKKAKMMMAAQLTGKEVTAYELELLAKDGHGVPVEVNTRIMYENGVPVGIQGIARDITERKRDEAARLISESKYEALFTLAPVGIYQSKPDGSFTTANATLARMLGYDSHDDLLKQNFADIYFDPDDRRKLFDPCGRQVLATDIDLQWKRKDGSPIWIQLTAHAVRNSDGETEYYDGFVRDITERKKSEANLLLVEEKYRSIFENAVEGIFQSSPEGQFISVNPAMAEMLGYDSPEELIAHRSDIATQHYVDPNTRTELERLLKDEDTVVAFEAEVFCYDGDKIWTTECMRAVRDESGKLLFYQGSIANITERKHLEEQLRQSQKMEAIGVLAGGIAHDFNNLLTAINGYSDLTLRKMAEGDPLRRNIEEVKRAGDRAAELTTQLLAFSRKQVLKPIVHNLNLVISNIEKMLRRIIKENIDLRTVLAPELGNIKADPGRIEQVIVNLAVNARDAMPGGGTLTIETKNVYLDEDYVHQHLSVSPGSFVRLTVTDSGSGIDEETQQQMFDPFFTTKDVGKGTGLGLSTVYGIVKQSGGDIMVYSEIGHGTTFKIYFPSVDDSVQIPKWIDGVKSHLGSETILLVEDEEIVRNLVREILRDNGYTVLEAASGRAALLICNTYTDPIHLLLTDVIMPRMGGTELSDKVVTAIPGIKVLFMSGYTDNTITQSGVLSSDIAFIEKPFTPDSLAIKVREVLEENINN